MHLLSANHRRLGAGKAPAGPLPANPNRASGHYGTASCQPASLPYLAWESETHQRYCSATTSRLSLGSSGGQPDNHPPPPSPQDTTAPPPLCWAKRLPFVACWTPTSCPVQYMQYMYVRRGTSQSSGTPRSWWLSSKSLTTPGIPSISSCPDPRYSLTKLFSQIQVCY